MSIGRDDRPLEPSFTEAVDASERIAADAGAEADGPVPNLASREASWVVAAARGDRAAFERLYERFQPMVHGVALAHAGREHADDLVHDVFLKALRHVREVRAPAAFAGWLRTIATHAARDLFRRPRVEAELPPELEAPARPVAEAEEVLEIVRSLPEAYRETLILRLVEGMTGPEIALRTGLTPGSVRVNLCRGMKLLDASLKEHGWI